MVIVANLNIIYTQVTTNVVWRVPPMDIKLDFQYIISKSHNI